MAEFPLRSEGVPTNSILQIVSGFKPSVDGMGDFARLLGTALWQTSHIQSHFLVYNAPQVPLDPLEVSPNTLNYPCEASPTAVLASVAELRSRYRFDRILLHYGPYAYSNAGEPAAFVRSIEELAKELTLLVFFHEVYASGPPWKRAFWTNREQRQSVAALLSLAQTAFTSNSKYQGHLEALNSTRTPLTCIPIFSNIGEPGGLRPLGERSRQLVIFGQLVTRVRLYRECRESIEDICRLLRITQVVDVGSGASPDMPDTIAGAPVRRMGFMEEHALSHLMSDSIAGLVGYWPDVWEKSGVIAAYQAHALVPIMVEMEKRSIAAPPDLPYVLAKDVPRLFETEDASGQSAQDQTADIRLQQLANGAYDRYRSKQSIPACVEVIASALRHIK